MTINFGIRNSEFGISNEFELGMRNEDFGIPTRPPPCVNARVGMKSSKFEIRDLLWFGGWRDDVR